MNFSKTLIISSLLCFGLGYLACNILCKCKSECKDPNGRPTIKTYEWCHDSTENGIVVSSSRVRAVAANLAGLNKLDSVSILKEAQISKRFIQNVLDGMDPADMFVYFRFGYEDVGYGNQQTIYIGNNRIVHDPICGDSSIYATPGKTGFCPARCPLVSSWN